jgi:hypothetical protein
VAYRELIDEQESKLTAVSWWTADRYEALCRKLDESVLVSRMKFELMPSMNGAVLRTMSPSVRAGDEVTDLDHA